MLVLVCFAGANNFLTNALLFTSPEVAPEQVIDLGLCVCITATDLLLAWNPVCLGLVEGVIGKIQLHAGK